MIAKTKDVEKGNQVDAEHMTLDIVAQVRRAGVLLKARALQNAIFNSANFSSSGAVMYVHSKDGKEVFRGYDSRAIAYIMKAVTFEGSVDVMKNLGRFCSNLRNFPGKDETSQ